MTAVSNEAKQSSKATMHAHCAFISLTTFSLLEGVDAKTASPEAENAIVAFTIHAGPLRQHARRDARVSERQAEGLLKRPCYKLTGTLHARI